MSNRRSSKEDEPTEKTSLLDDEKKDDALSTGPVIDIYDKSNFGYLAQYYAVGLIYGGLPATVYGFFVGYLNVPAYVYSTSGVIMTMPWAFKFFFGAINDCCPIFGYRRKPYMVIGWAFCSAMLVVLSQMRLPDPYWCVDPNTGEYIVKKTMTDGSNVAADPCNAAAANQGGRFAMVMMLAALGYVIADVAADGLTVEFARREPISRRGRTQTTAYLTRTLGSVSSILLVGFGMNSREYNGSFDQGLSFNTICAILAVPAALMVPVSWFFISETKCTDPMSFSAYAKLSYQLLKSKALFYVVLYQFLTSMIGQISTTAGGMVKNYWAGVQNLQNQLFSLVGNLLFGIGLYIVRKHFLNYSWRKMLLITSVGLNIVDMPFVFLTIYNVVRNQYFYLGETVLVEIPAAANFVVGTFVIVEMAENGNEVRSHPCIPSCTTFISARLHICIIFFISPAPLHPCILASTAPPAPMHLLVCTHAPAHPYRGWSTDCSPRWPTWAAPLRAPSATSSTASSAPRSPTQTTTSKTLASSATWSLSPLCSRTASRSSRSSRYSFSPRRRRRRSDARRRGRRRHGTPSSRLRSSHSR